MDVLSDSGSCFLPSFTTSPTPGVCSEFAARKLKPDSYPCRKVSAFCVVIRQQFLKHETFHCVKFLCASGSEMHTRTELDRALPQESPQAPKSCIAIRYDLYDVFTFTAHYHPRVNVCLQRLSCSDVNNLTSLSNGEPTVVCKYFKNCLTVIQTCKLMARRKGRSLVVFG